MLLRLFTAFLVLGVVLASPVLEAGFSSSIVSGERAMPACCRMAAGGMVCCRAAPTGKWAPSNRAVTDGRCPCVVHHGALRVSFILCAGGAYVIDLAAMWESQTDKWMRPAASQWIHCTSTGPQTPYESILRRKCALII